MFFYISRNIGISYIKVKLSLGCLRTESFQIKEFTSHCSECLIPLLTVILLVFARNLMALSDFSYTCITLHLCVYIHTTVVYVSVLFVLPLVLSILPSVRRSQNSFHNPQRLYIVMERLYCTWLSTNIYIVEDDCMCYISCETSLVQQAGEQSNWTEYPYSKMFDSFY